MNDVSNWFTPQGAAERAFDIYSSPIFIFIFLVIIIDIVVIGYILLCIQEEF